MSPGRKPIRALERKSRDMIGAMTSTKWVYLNRNLLLAIMIAHE